MSRAIVYARVSTEDQARHGYSLPNQVAQCRQKAEELGATTIVECVDEGISGDVLERPGLTTARQLIREGGVSLFICYDPDRLARKLAHQLLLTDEIEQSSCRLVFVNFDWKDTPEGRLFYSLRGAIAEYEKEKIKERTMRGLRQKAKQGGLTHDPGAYGYKYNAKTNNLDIIPAEADVYRMMSKWFLEEQLGYSGIAARLTQMGIPTKRGAKTWAPTTVSRMLTNPLYKGELWLQRYDTVGKRSNRYRRPPDKIAPRVRPREHWVMVNVPAIVDDKTFEAHTKQAERISRFFRRRSFHGQYLLSGLIRCGLCGAAMSGTTNSNGQRYYRCNSRSLTRDLCTQKYFRAEVLENPVWDEIVRWIENSVPGECKPETWEAKADQDRLVIEKHLGDAAKERERLIDLVQKGLTSTHEISKRMEELAERIRKLTEALAQKQQQSSLMIPPRNDIGSMAELVQMGIKALDFSGRQRVIRELIHQVIIMPDEITIWARIRSR